MLKYFLDRSSNIDHVSLGIALEVAAATGKLSGTQGAYRSPSPLPSQSLLASYAANVVALDNFSGNFDIVEVDRVTATTAQLYPLCPAPPPPVSGTGGSAGDSDQQLNDLLGYVTSDPPENQECSWTKHEHPAYTENDPVPA